MRTVLTLILVAANLACARDVPLAADAALLDAGPPPPPDAGSPLPADAGFPPPDAGTFSSFESCCAALGCATDAAMAACAAYPPAYGRCAIQGGAGVCVAQTLCRSDWYS